jgi:hypothetical protein
MADLGLILQRVGAGFQGNLPQFDAARANQQALRLEADDRRAAKAQALSNERAQAAAQDAQIALRYLKAGAVPDALKLIDNRIGFINQFKGDPTDTQAVRDLIAAGDIESAMGELELFTTAAESRGLIKPLVTAAERINQGELDLKAAEFEAKYGRPAPGSVPRTPGAGGGMASAPAGGGTEGAKLRLDQQKSDREAQAAAREQAKFNAEQKDIPAQWMKQYTDSTAAELSATQRAAELSQLAADFEAAPPMAAGFRATLNEVAKSIFGEQDATTALRERFSGARNSQVMKNLPPGVASDRDIELAMAGYPGDKAPKENITGFLRGQVKVQALEAAYERFKVEYIDKNRTLRGVSDAWKQEAPRVFDEIKGEISKPLNRSYSIEQIDAELAKRGR